MTGKESARFEDEWSLLEPRLHGLLAQRGVSSSLREDIVQETALRLIRMWPGVDVERDVFPLAATIALNLARDNARRLAKREVLGEIPEGPGTEDVERAVLSRLDLEQVARAFPKLREAHRRVLLRELDSISDSTRDPERRSRTATNMVRLRARRRLAHLIGAASSFFGALIWRLSGPSAGHYVPATTAACFAALVVLTPPSVTAPAPGSFSLKPKEAIVRVDPSSPQAIARLEREAPSIEPASRTTERALPGVVGGGAAWDQGADSIEDDPPPADEPNDEREDASVGAEVGEEGNDVGADAGDSSLGVSNDDGSVEVCAAVLTGEKCEEEERP